MNSCRSRYQRCRLVSSLKTRCVSDKPKADTGAEAVKGSFVRAVALHFGDLAAALTNGRFYHGVAAYRYWVAGVAARLCKCRYLRSADISGSRSTRHRCGFLLKGIFREVGLRASRLQRSHAEPHANVVKGPAVVIWQHGMRAKLLQTCCRIATRQLRAQSTGCCRVHL